jgi:hypothetical protein
LTIVLPNVVAERSEKSSPDRSEQVFADQAFGLEISADFQCNAPLKAIMAW